MNRKDFIQKIVRLGILLVLSAITFMLGKKLVLKKDCNSCPEYASCSDYSNCKIESSK